ncbi:GNAT family N-acetyltransferase [Vibrio kasasachensis]|uniref:GNAT family N-acetyltransferase n=1 Tax=Vibrio kasasachensis TaxID=2910248 RepID=UPI003D0E2B9B
MLFITPMLPEHHTQLLQLALAEEQIKYVGSMEEMLANIGATTHPHVLVFNDKVIGFFLLDLLYHCGYSFCPPDGIGLRAYFVDGHQQGQGYGTDGMRLLPNYIKHHYPERRSVYLTVNCLNTAAYRCYFKAGFVDTNELYHGGAAGPLRVMALPIVQAG